MFISTSVPLASATGADEPDAFGAGAGPMDQPDHRSDRTAKKSLSILVVEDEAMIAWLLNNILEDCGHAVCGIASTAQESLDLARANRPDVVFMDITLKGERDGIWAAEQMKALFGLKVIFLTARVDTFTRTRAKLVEPLAYLTKPFSETEIAAVLKQAGGEGS